MKAAVIYKIVNVVNGKFYVGSTMDTRERFRTHRSKLRRNAHHCKHLQAAWNKYGEDCFKFTVIEEVANMGLLQAAEDVWLVEWVGRPECYNSGLRSGAPMRGMPKELTPNWGKAVSTEQKAAISATLKALYAADPNNHPRRGKKHTPEALAKIAANRKPPAGADHYRFGKTVSPEVRAKIGDAQRGVKKAPRTISPEGRAKIDAAAAAGRYNSFGGKSHSDEAKAKMSRPVVAKLPNGSVQQFSGLTVMRDTLEVSIATLIRGCKSGKPIKSGVCAGWVVSYADGPQNEAPEIPAAYKDIPRTRAAAKDAGAQFYYTGTECTRGHLSPRAVKGACIECRREDDRVQREKMLAARKKA